MSKQLITELRKKIEELEKELAKQEADMGACGVSEDEAKLAELMHQKMCHDNHADGCSWLYEKSWADTMHNNYIMKIRKMRKILFGDGGYMEILFGIINEL